MVRVASLLGMGEMESHPPHDPALMRVSDKDRQRVADVLREAAGEGRLDLDELDERLDATWSAKTYADLVPITADLHAPAEVPRPPSPPVSRTSGVPVAGHGSSTAILGDCQRRGVWQVPEAHTAFSLMGSVTIDLREAVLTGTEAVITATAIMGDVSVYVPAHFRVIVDGTPILGEFSQGRDKTPAEVGPDSPTVRVRGLALMGSVTVQRRPAPGTPRKYLGTY